MLCVVCAPAGVRVQVCTHRDVAVYMYVLTRNVLFLRIN
jgi:hypothetical protein